MTEMLVSNERIKSYMTDPTLYRTVVTIGNHVGSTKMLTCYSWAEGDDIQSAEDISVQFICQRYDVNEDDFTEVSTDSYGLGG